MVESVRLIVSVDILPISGAPPLSEGAELLSPLGGLPGVSVESAPSESGLPGASVESLLSEFPLPAGAPPLLSLGGLPGASP